MPIYSFPSCFSITATYLPSELVSMPKSEINMAI